MRSIQESVASKTWPVAAAGIFMILLLTANGIAQSVRERTPEFAVLETLGYRPSTLLTLVFAEAAIPCLAGAVLGAVFAILLSSVPTAFLPAALSIDAQADTLARAWSASHLAAHAAGARRRGDSDAAPEATRASATPWRVAEMRTLIQTLVLTYLGILGILQRKWSSMVLIGSVACVIGVLLSMLSVTAGMLRSYRAGEDPRLAIVLGPESTTEWGNGIPASAVGTIFDAPGIAKSQMAVRWLIRRF